eukprot:gnl/TRDRNA2_/TRDRNA2_193974_c0_seq1.p1 gnl/TRDRNA2_/TRDRNA2_193974_c0~~gnl/TRDRNA2_/TRDRNA2_193974_c0_seq1.p1  ORF type:complete len:211 (+),score=55.07 gnl/TRDRNA2_/TRDRNA2_193974_c0_seq1:49-681(+)
MSGAASLSDAFAKQDFAAANQILADDVGKDELLPLLRGVLSELAASEARRAPDPRACSSTRSADRFVRDPGVQRPPTECHDGAAHEELWRRQLRTFFESDTEFVLVLQRKLLEGYQSSAFQKSVRLHEAELKRRKWDDVPAEERRAMREELRMDVVLRQMLPQFGFSPDWHGVDEMRAIVEQNLVHPDVAYLDKEIEKASNITFQPAELE